MSELTKNAVINKISVDSEDGLIITNSKGQQSTFVLGSQGDFYISNPVRKSTGRALVVTDQQLNINYVNDFTEGVTIWGPLFVDTITIKDIQDSSSAPAGTTFYKVVIGDDGKLYRKKTTG